MEIVGGPGLIRTEYVFKFVCTYIHKHLHIYKLRSKHLSLKRALTPEERESERQSSQSRKSANESARGLGFRVTV